MISILTESMVKIVRMTLPSISPVFRIPCTLHLIVNVTHVTTVAAAAIAADAVQLVRWDQEAAQDRRVSPVRPAQLVLPVLLVHLELPDPQDLLAQLESLVRPDLPALPESLVRLDLLALLEVLDLPGSPGQPDPEDQPDQPAHFLTPPQAAYIPPQPKR